MHKATVNCRLGPFSFARQGRNGARPLSSPCSSHGNKWMGRPVRRIILLLLRRWPQARVQRVACSRCGSPFVMCKTLLATAVPRLQQHFSSACVVGLYIVNPLLRSTGWTVCCPTATRSPIWRCKDSCCSHFLGHIKLVTIEQVILRLSRQSTLATGQVIFQKAISGRRHACLRTSSRLGS